jgi:hypothetical protein
MPERMIIGVETKIDSSTVQISQKRDTGIPTRSTHTALSQQENPQRKEPTTANLPWALSPLITLVRSGGFPFFVLRAS